MARLAGSFGQVIEVTSATAYDAGDFWAKGSLAGVVMNDIPANGKGAVVLEGVIHNVPKTANSVVITVGAKLYSADNANSVNTTSSSRVAVGYALSASTASQSTVDVLLAPGIG